MKKLTISFLLMIIAIMTISPVFASTSGSNSLNGTEVPTIVWNLSTQGAYGMEGSIERQGPLYSSRLFTGASYISVIMFYNTTGSGTDVTLLNAAGQEIYTLWCPVTSTSVTLNFPGLNSSERYYIRFDSICKFKAEVRAN